MADEQSLHRHPAPADPLLADAVEAIDLGDADRLRSLLAEHPDMVHQRVTAGDDMYTAGYFRGPTLLHFVAANPCVETAPLPTNLVELAALLLDAGAAVDAGCGEDGTGTTLGLVASGRLIREAGHQLAMIQLLCERGADPDRALPAALGEGQTDAARALLDAGAQRTLEVHAAFNDWREVKGCVTHEAPTDLQKRQALARAAQFGHAKPIFYLCSADYGDVDPSGFNPDGEYHAHSTPLHQAAYHGHADAAAELVKWGATLDTKDRMWAGTPRDWAEHGGQDEVVKLLDEAAQVVPIVHAALAGDLESLGRSLDEHPRWLDDELPIFGFTLIGNLCHLNNRRTEPGRTIRFLIERGASVEPDGDGESYLHCAASDGSPELGIACIDALLDAGVDIDVLGGVGTGGTPLHNATIFQLREIGAHLIQRGATVDLFLAAGNGRPERVKAMFDEQGHLRDDAPRVPGLGEDESPQHRINWAFYVAAQAGDVETLQFLHPKVTERVTLPDGLTVVDRAIQHDHQDAEAWLREQGFKTQAELDDEGDQCDRT
jgi:ankyrin repeat protein